MSVTLSNERLSHSRIGPRLLCKISAWSAAATALAALLTPTMAAAQQIDGERMFGQRCGACHSIDPGQKKSGPHLTGVIGRTAGSIEGARYSAPMRASSIIWDKATLDTFLAAPRRLIPGTTMTVAVPDATQRAAIITYLEGQQPTANN
ncbi:c-type cytochrome [Rhizobium leguminosarum]|uniref:c-type cytochrome n=1 Tax=Rhizobium leguminosarum TaxID=384 RepID=UPI0039658950